MFCVLFSIREKETESERENEKLKNNVVKGRNNYQHTYRSGDSSGSDFFYSFLFLLYVRCAQSPEERKEEKKRSDRYEWADVDLSVYAHSNEREKEKIEKKRRVGGETRSTDDSN